MARPVNWLLPAIPLVVLVCTVIVFLVSLQSGPPVRHSGRLGQPAPELTLPPVPGIALAGLEPAALEGRWVVVNFWASWCPPCRVEHPHLMDLATQDDILLVGVAYKDKPADAARFLTQLGNPFARLGSDASGRLAIDWGVSGVPETFLVSPEGVIVAHHAGPITPDLLASWPLPRAAQ